MRSLKLNFLECMGKIIPMIRNVPIVALDSLLRFLIVYFFVFTKMQTETTLSTLEADTIALAHIC